MAIKVGGGGGVLDRKNAFQNVSFMLFKHSELQHLDRNYTRKASSSFSQGCLSSVHLGRHCHHSCIKIDQPLPAAFAYFKRSKTGQ